MRHLRTAITFPRHATEVPLSAVIWGAGSRAYRTAPGWYQVRQVMLDGERHVGTDTLQSAPLPDIEPPLRRPGMARRKPE